mmetsp:Transcript_2647/g.10592  ORF Transcript_2647/g.10592 Transcript_2647/m.10592 type:complete len:95 (-) Transcript_2647:902-1186(-)
MLARSGCCVRRAARSQTGVSVQDTQTRTHLQTQTRASHTPFLPDSVRARASLRGSALHFLLLDGGGHDIALRDLLCDVAYGGGAVRHEDSAGAR